jgi:Ni/Co efflux regulator RcnB
MGSGHAGGAAVLGGRQPATTVFGRRPPNWNNYPRQFDRQVYQRNITASRRYHWHSYNRPHGWYYQRWVFGQIFPSIFWARDYWITDYWMFDLPIPPYGYVWVRYGDDALLINRRTGTVLQVVYGVFY